MELGTREILLAVGLLLIVVIVLDGIRRLRQSGQGQIRMGRRQRVFDEDEGSYDPYGGELTGEVRVRERGEREAPVVRTRPAVRTRSVDILEDEDDPLLNRSPAARQRGRRPVDGRADRSLEESPRRAARQEPVDALQGHSSSQDPRWREEQEPPRPEDSWSDEEPLRAPNRHTAAVHDYDEPRPEEEQPELMLEPQQEAFDLIEEAEPGRRAPLRRREAPPPAAEDFEQDIRDAVAAEPPAGRNRSRAQQRDVDRQDTAAPPSDAQHEAPMPEVIALHIMAGRRELFHGDELLEAFMANDLRYGSMKIFHRHQDQDGIGPVLFSLANSVKPGTFDLNSMHDFRTPGVSLFMALDDLENPSDAFEQLLDVAHNLAAALKGELKDESRSALTRQTEDHCRQRIKEFERRRLYRANPV